MRAAREESFPRGARLFDEGGRTGRAVLAAPSSVRQAVRYLRYGPSAATPSSVAARTANQTSVKAAVVVRSRPVTSPKRRSR